MSDLANELVDRFNKNKANRTNFEILWQQAADLMDPTGGDYNTTRSPGEKRTQRIFEQTAAQSLEKFVAVMEAYHTPRTQRWHHLRASDEDLNKVKAVREFFERAEDTLFKIRNSPRARFYGQIYEVIKNLGLTGNGCLYVEEAPAGGIRYRHIHVGSAYIEVNHEGVVDTVYHQFELKPRAARQRFGENLSRAIKNADPMDSFKFLQVVRPNHDRDMDRKDAKGQAFESVVIDLTERMMVGKPEGYHELPFIWTRYTVNPSEIYGRGPATMVLPDVSTLQEMQKTFLRAGQKVVDPPLLVHDDRKMGRGAKKIRLEPGGLNAGGLDKDGRPMIAPLITGGRLDLTDVMMDQLRKNIREAFLIDHFELLEQERVQMTATEVLERAKEKGQLLTPIIGRQQAEFLGPLIEREIGIAQRQGLLGPLPEDLIEAEGEYEIEYESDATRMQRADEVAAFVRMNEVMLPYIQADPNLLRKVKAEDAMEHYGQDLGVPSKLFRTEDEMAEEHAAMQAQMERDRMPEEAKAVGGLVRDISQVAA